MDGVVERIRASARHVSCERRLYWVDDSPIITPYCMKPKYNRTIELNSADVMGVWTDEKDTGFSHNSFPSGPQFCPASDRHAEPKERSLRRWATARPVVSRAMAGRKYTSVSILIIVLCPRVVALSRAASHANRNTAFSSALSFLQFEFMSPPTRLRPHLQLVPGTTLFLAT